VKAGVLAWVEKTRRRSGWTIERILQALGVPKTVYYEWLQRQKTDRLDDAQNAPPRVNRLLPEERQAILAFALKYTDIGYRKLTWMMNDHHVVAVSETAVYRVLDDADALYRWKPSEASDGEYRFKPSCPNEQWHTDVMYVWVAGCWYFLLSFIDAYSRYIVHHKLLLELAGKHVALELEAALENTREAKPRIVHDHGSEFVNKDLRAVIKAHNLLDIRTKRCHPESNGIAERFNGTVRRETRDDYGGNYLEAEATIKKMIDHYNNERLHAALGYIEPREFHFGDPDQRRQQRYERIAEATELRKAINRMRLNQRAHVA
jgi:transposase InsO family protein